MWPWEHALLAYVCYSVLVHLRYGESPDGGPTLVLVVAAVLPDLIDKPLGPGLGVFPSGYAVGHSVLLAGPIAVGYALLRTRGRERYALAFGVGYLLHIAGDVLMVSLRRGTLYVDHVLWPVVVHQGTVDGPLGPMVRRLLVGYWGELSTLEFTPLLAVQVGSVVAGVVLWVADGMPGVRATAAGTWRLVDWLDRAE